MNLEQNMNQISRFINRITFFFDKASESYGRNNTICLQQFVDHKKMPKLHNNLCLLIEIHYYKFKENKIIFQAAFSTILR